MSDTPRPARHDRKCSCLTCIRMIERGLLHGTRCCEYGNFHEPHDCAKSPGLAESRPSADAPRSADSFRKKPVVIRAKQFTGANLAAILFWMGSFQESAGSRSGFERDGQFIIRTLESNEFVVSENDWVIRGIKGEFYACKPDIFEATYEAVD